jgi:hypothetical protein
MEARGSGPSYPKQCVAFLDLFFLLSWRFYGRAAGCFASTMMVLAVLLCGCDCDLGWCRPFGFHRYWRGMGAARAVCCGVGVVVMVEEMMCGVQRISPFTCVSVARSRQ